MFKEDEGCHIIDKNSLHGSVICEFWEKQILYIFCIYKYIHILYKREMRDDEYCCLVTCDLTCLQHTTSHWVKTLRLHCLMKETNGLNGVRFPNSQPAFVKSQDASCWELVRKCCLRYFVHDHFHKQRHLGSSATVWLGIHMQLDSWQS